MRLRILTPILVLATAMSAGARPATILEIQDSLHTEPVVYPESFETDVREMQENWYLRTYADIDRDADSRASVEVSDAELIERLSKLPTVIELPYNSLVKDFIMMYANKRKQLVENMLGLGLYYMPIFEQALDRHGMPMELKYLPVIESALNPNAVSRAGATGLWQFMVETATGEGLEVNSIVDQRRDPYASSEAAAVYLKKLYSIYNDWSLAIAAYNCGPGNVNKAMRRAGGTDKKDFWQIYQYLPKETRGYVPAFIAAVYIMNYYDRHNISPALAKKPLAMDTIHVTRRIHFEQISEVLDIPVEEIKVLNPQYRTDLIPGDIKPYTLVLPSLQVYAYAANEDSISNHNAAKYARRDVVEPGGTQQQVTGSDAQGEYVEELVVKYHTVKKGETLTSIARKYGVTIESIQQANNCGKKVKKGQKLRINTYKRTYISTTPAEPTLQTDSLSVPNDSIVVTPNPTDSTTVNNRVSDTLNQSENRQQQQQTQQQTQTNRNRNSSNATQGTYTVKKGDTLGKIAQKYGVTVKAIKDANGLRSDRINVGQKLKIPAKKKRR